MSFDPSLPFEVEGGGFDPSQPFEVEDATPPKGPKSRYTNPTRGRSALSLGLSGAGRFLGDLSFARRQIATDIAGTFDPAAKEESEKMESIADLRQLDPVRNTTAGKVGYTAAAMVPAVGAAFVPGANTITGAGLIGGGMGFMQPTGSQDSRFENTVKTGIAGAVGQGVFNGIGRIAQPVKKALNPAQVRAVATLEKEGVALDAAQRSGSPLLGRVKSALSDNPLTLGGQVEAATAQKAQFNRAVLQKIGADADLADEAAMGPARSKISAVFDDVLSRTQTRLHPSDLTRASVIKATAARRLNNDNRIATIIDEIGAHTKANKGVLDGRFYQSVRGDLGAMESQRDIGPIARDLREALDDAFQRSAKGGDGPALQEARRQWRNMRIIENAIDESGNISPAKLANQFGQKRNRYAGVYGKGDKSILDLARLAKAGKQVIPDKTPQSGTIPRGMMQVAAPAAIGGAYGAYKEGDMTGIGSYALGGALLPFALQKGLNSPAATRYLTQGITTPIIRNTLMAPSRAGLGAALPAYLLSQQ